MRNFSRGYKSNNSSNFSRNDRRNDRDNFRSNDSYKRPSEKSFNRFSDNKKPRRDYEGNTSRNSYNQDRRDHGGNRYSGGDRSFDRSARDTKYRNHTPPRNRDYDGHSESRFNRSSPPRFRQRTPPPSTSSFRSRNDFNKPSIRSRLSRGGLSVRRGTRTGAGRISNDFRSGISKRSAPAIRSKEYAKKIKQARLKLNESNNRDKSDDDEPKTPPKQDDKESKHEDNEDFLDVANDVNFEEDDEDAAEAKNDESKASKDDKEEKEEKTDKTSSDKANTSGTTSTSEKEKTRKERSEKSPSKENDKASSIEWNCIHCPTKCSTVNEYRSHLARRTHMLAMRKVSLRARLTLNRLRKVQRDRQLEIEARVKNVENIPSKYCQICKLYFRQSNNEHRDSDDHKKIKNFLKPFCKICRVHMISAMKYEIHRCTVEHIRRKAKKHETSDDEIDLQDIDLGEFKTVDSVGDVDGEVESTMEDDEFTSKEETSVGTEFVNKIEVNYCSLCREYLSRSSNDEKVVSEHCKSKKHLKWYYQSKKKEGKATQSKDKKSEETGETSKEDVTSTSLNEGEKTVKKSAEKEEKTDEISNENEKDGKNENGEGDMESSTKFTRYFDQPQEN